MKVLLPFLALLGLGACATGTQVPKAQIDHQGQMLFNGHTADNLDCYTCHDGDGLGTGRGADLAKVVPPMSDAAILDTIVNGADWMPAFGDKTTEAQRQEILTWLRETFGHEEEKVEDVEAETVEDAEF